MSCARLTPLADVLRDLPRTNGFGDDPGKLLDRLHSLGRARDGASTEKERNDAATVTAAVTASSTGEIFENTFELSAQVAQR